MRLILIHGRSQQGKDPAALKDEWMRALQHGLDTAGRKLPAGTDVQFPFYGDKLDELVTKVNTSLVDAANYRGDSDAGDAEAAFRGMLLQEMADEYGLSDAKVLEEAQERGMAVERGPQNWSWVQALLRTFDRTPLGSRLIDDFTRDVYVYLNFGGVRREVDAIVAKELSPEPCVVVAHSLGTVVGYNVLSKAAGSGNVRGFITVGSPLGIRSIRRKLDTPLAMPRCARRWFNARDKYDVVALYALDKGSFAIDPEIENLVMKNETGGRHGIEGYLGDRTVAGRICDALES